MLCYQYSIDNFYFLMGTKIQSTVLIEVFILKFDLVKIHQGTLLQFQIHCRKLPMLRFRSTSIGLDCVVKGMVLLGSSIGNNVAVEKLSVVQE